MKRYLYPRYYQAGGDTKKIDWSWGNSNPFEQTKLQQGLSIAAGTAQLAGSFYDRVKRKDMDQFENQFNQFGDYQFGANSNNSLMQELNSIKTQDKLDYEDVGGITWKEGIGNTLNDTMVGISAGSTFGPWGALIGGVVGGVSGITSSLISAKNSRQDVIDMEKKRNAAINKFNANARFKIQDLNNMNADYMKRQMYAQGGLLDGVSNFIEFNAGGSHEQNPLNGVQQGIAPDGQPNLVEEGETRYGDYIFSKRLKPSKSLLKEFNLGDDYVDYSGKSFAEISKALADDSGYTSSPTDPIAIETFDIMMNRLQDAQETHKQRAEQHKMAQVMDKLPDEQKAAIMQQMMMQQPQAGIQDMQPQVYSQPRIGFARGGHLFVTGTPETSSLSEDRQQWIKEHYDRWYKVLKNAGYKGSNWNIDQFITNASNGIYGPAHQEAGLLYDLYRNMEHITPIRINIPEDSITNPTKIIGPTMLMNSEEYQPLGFTFKTLGNFDYNLKNTYIPSINEEITSSTNTESQPVVNGKDESRNKKSDNTKKIKINKIDFPTSTSTPVGLEGQPESLPIDWSPTSFYDENGNFLGEQEDKIYPTWMCYAPVAMSGASMIADFLGANDPDYTNANAIQNSVSRPMMIGYNPVGLYQRWMPSDREYRIAQMNQQSANARNQANMSSNAATARANMAAINNAALNSYGDYAVKADAQNNVDRNSIIAANNALDLQNAQMALQADRYNQAAYSEWSAQQARANQLAASMREQIDTASAAAKNANRNAFAEDLGNIGLQNFYMNNINTSSMYKVGIDGIYYYNGQPVVMLGTNIPTIPTIPQTTDSVIHQAYGGRIGFARRKGGFIVR